MEISEKAYLNMCDRLTFLENTINNIFSLAKEKSTIVSLVRSDKPIDRIITVADIVDSGIELMVNATDGIISLKQKFD